MCRRSWRSAEMRAGDVGLLGLDDVLELVDLVVEVVDEVEIPRRFVEGRYASRPAESVGYAAFLTIATSQAGLPPGGVLRTVRSASCVMTRSISR
jgi:hypothetical protein